MTNQHQEPNQIPGKIVVLVLGGAMLIASLAVAVEALMLARAEPRGQLRSALPRETRTVGSIQQRTFDHGAASTELKSAQLRHLASYGWVDRDRGVVHLPIERAMDLWIERARTGAAQQGADFSPGGKAPGAEIKRSEPGRTRSDRPSRTGTVP
jgi:hypothetical protein